MAEEHEDGSRTVMGHAPLGGRPLPEPSGPIRTQGRRREASDTDASPPAMPPAAPPVMPSSPLAPRARSHDDRPLIEVEVVHQVGPAPRMDPMPEVLEVWTMNRVYVCDARGMCVSVRERRDGGQESKDNPVLGARLIGGQLREGEAFGIAVPYPRPGMEAVFEHPAGAKTPFSRTSPVERVVLRLQHFTVEPSRLVPTWSEITKRGF
ncbi:MAG: hypothetical protein AAGH15_21310 [Myxococcota bacterium]